MPIMVDADHGYGNALNVRRTVEELETIGVSGLTIEDTDLPKRYGIGGPPGLISIEEGSQRSARLWMRVTTRGSRLLHERGQLKSQI